MSRPTYADVLAAAALARAEQEAAFYTSRSYQLEQQQRRFVSTVQRQVASRANLESEWRKITA